MALRYNITILFFLISLPLMAAQTEFEKLLEKNPSYKSAVENYEKPSESSKTKEDFNKASTALDKYLEEKRNLKAAPQIDLRDQAAIDMKGCKTCESYLNLSGDINQILSRMPQDPDVSVANKNILELNKLNFQYYVVKHESFDGGVFCQKYGNFTKIKEGNFQGSFALRSEEFFDLPNVNEVQYIPEGAKEVIYLYRGIGAQQNTIIEVHMKNNKEALIRYFDYTPSSAENLARANTPLLENALEELMRPSEKEKPAGDNFIQLGVDLKTRDKIIPTDVELMNAQTKTSLSDDLVLGTKTNISYNEQQTEVSLDNKAGVPWVTVNAKLKTEGKTEFVTVVPMSIDIDQDAKLKVGGAYKSEIGLTKATGQRDQAHTVNLGLTDHNNKYIDIEVYQKPADKYSRVTVTNTTKLGDIGDVGINYSQDSAGDKKFSIGKNTNLGSYGTLKTEFGGGNNTKPFVAVQHEMAIGKTSTLSIGARASDGKQVTTMFQFQSKF